MKIHRVSNRRATVSVFSILTVAPEVGLLFIEQGSPRLINSSDKTSVTSCVADYF